MAVSKVILNGDTLMDVTQDSVTAGTLLSGETATGADGVRLTGSATIPQPSSTTPAMDGTAAVGTSTDYARADHVHPTDTSRAAASHVHAAADVTSGTLDIARIPTGTTSGTVAVGNHTHTVAGINGLQSALNAKQATLVSGTNIKTIGGVSLLGSGDVAGLPSVSASDDGKVLRVVNGSWAAASLPSASGVSF